MQEIHNRAFKGIWIPRDIWLAEDLGWTEKLVLVELDSLNGQQGCWASNEYLASFFGLSKGRISKVISSLKDKGYIQVEMQYRPGTKEIEKRIIKTTFLVWSETSIPHNTKQLEGIVENDHTPIVENSQENNTVINNTFNNTNNKTDKQTTGQLVSQPFARLVDFVNKNIQPVTEAIGQELGCLLDEYNDADLILEAFKIAIFKNAKNKYKFVNTVLRNWRNELVTTHEQFKAKEERDSASSKRSNAACNGANQSTIPTFVTKRSSLE